MRKRHAGWACETGMRDESGVSMRNQKTGLAGDRRPGSACETGVQDRRAGQACETSMRKRHAGWACDTGMRDESGVSMLDQKAGRAWGLRAESSCGTGVRDRRAGMACETGMRTDVQERRAVSPCRIKMRDRYTERAWVLHAGLSCMTCMRDKHP